MSLDYKRRLREFFELYGVDIVVEARKWASLVKRDPTAGDDAVEKALISLIDLWKTPPRSMKSLRLHFQQAVWQALRGHQEIIFFSYSHLDTEFVDTIARRLDERGIRYWWDCHDLKSGRLETQLDRAVRNASTVLLVLSENSVESDWVEWEGDRARKLEKELDRDVLCPIALDDAWKTCSWPGPLRRQIEDYHILDFSGWRDEETLEHQLRKLLDGLKLYYEPREEV